MRRHTFESIAASVLLCAVTLVGGLSVAVQAETIPSPGLLDARVRVAPYSPDQVYRLTGFVGYQIDLQFEAGEAFVGLAAGDIEGLSFVARGQSSVPQAQSGRDRHESHDRDHAAHVSSRLLRCGPTARCDGRGHLCAAFCVSA